MQDMEPLLNHTPPFCNRIKSVCGWRVRISQVGAMFSGKVVSPDDLVLRSSDQTASSARFPLNLIRTYNQIFNPRDVSSYYHLAMLAEQNPRNLESRKIDASPSGNILMLDSSSRTVKATGLDVRDWPVRSKFRSWLRDSGDSNG